VLEIEFLLTVIALPAAFVCPWFGGSWLENLESQFSRYAQRRTLAFVTAGVVALIIRLACLPILPVPEPGITQ
jgi:hypothetical protein